MTSFQRYEFDGQWGNRSFGPPRPAVQGPGLPRVARSRRVLEAAGRGLLPGRGELATKANTMTFAVRPAAWQGDQPACTPKMNGADPSRPLVKRTLPAILRSR